jgi:hypothetical protein
MRRDDGWGHRRIADHSGAWQKAASPYRMGPRSGASDTMMQTQIWDADANLGRRRKSGLFQLYIAD